MVKLRIPVQYDGSVELALLVAFHNSGGDVERGRQGYITLVHPDRLAIRREWYDRIKPSFGWQLLSTWATGDTIEQLGDILIISDKGEGADA